jgi:hypothetical protein
MNLVQRRFVLPWTVTGMTDITVTLQYVGGNFCLSHSFGQCRIIRACGETSASQSLQMFNLILTHVLSSNWCGIMQSAWVHTFCKSVLRYLALRSDIWGSQPDDEALGTKHIVVPAIFYFLLYLLANFTAHVPKTHSIQPKMPSFFF